MDEIELGALVRKHAAPWERPGDKFTAPYRLERDELLAIVNAAVEQKAKRDTMPDVRSVHPVDWIREHRRRYGSTFLEAATACRTARQATAEPARFVVDYSVPIPSDGFLPLPTDPDAAGGTGG